MNRRQFPKGNLGGAEKEFRSAARLGSPEALLSIGVILGEKGQLHAAATVAPRAVKLLPNDPDPHLLLGGTLEQLGDLDGAMAQNPDDPWYHAALGVALFQSGKFEQSKKDLDRAISLKPSIASAYLWRARLFERLGERNQAIADLEAYTVLRPKSARAYPQLEKLYAAEGEVKKTAAARGRYEELTSGNNESGSQPSYLNLLLVERISENLRQVE